MLVLLPFLGAIELPSFAADAEYAIRWNPAQGGPKTADDAVAVLRDKAKGDSDTFVIQYLEVQKPPSDAPLRAKSILRQREGDGKYELMFKYRGTEPLVSPKCALQTASDPKDEVDVSLLGAGELPKRVYSFSCKVVSERGPVMPPSELEAKLIPCSSTMTRRKTKRTMAKIEEWHLPGGSVVLEVSRKGSDAEPDLRTFQKEIAGPLLAAGINPSDTSKTELGSACR